MDPMMAPPAETAERLVCAILAAQAADVRDRIDSVEAVDLLWRSADILSQLSGLVLELQQRLPSPDAALNDRCAAAVDAGIEAGRSLDQMAFLRAQRQDFCKQLADCLVISLGRLAAADTPVVTRLSLDDLAALYISEDQRNVHQAAIRQFAIDELRGAKGQGSTNPRRVDLAG